MIKTQILEIGINDKNELVISSQGKNLYITSHYDFFKVHDLVRAMRTAIENTYEHGKLTRKEAETLFENFTKLVINFGE